MDMTIVQEAFFIPNDIKTGLATGLLRRIGGVVRYASGPKKGQIFKHLEPVNLKAAEQVQNVGVNRALKFVKQHKKGTLIALASAATIGTSIWVYHKIKNHEPKVVTDFRNSLRVYIEAIRKGQMDIEKINDLMESLGKLKEHRDYEKIGIQLTTGELEVLVGRIYEYTAKLARDNEVELTEDEFVDSDKKSTDIIVNLQTYLKAQKHIFEKAS